MKETKKSKLILMVFAVSLLLVFVVLTAVACKPQVVDPTPINRLNIKPLEDLKNYGDNAQFYTVAASKYDATVRSNKKADLVGKQNEERKAAYERMLESGQPGYTQEVIVTWDATSWNNEQYHRFALPYLNGEEWERDNYDTTVTKVFCYADMEKVMTRLSEAGVSQPEMEKLVAYIVRSDDTWKNADKDKYATYNYIEGQGSAILDFNDIDELDEILGNWSSRSTDGKLDGKTENDWKDLQSLKRRKVNGELYRIFGDKADMFARFSIHMTAYQYEVLEQVILPLYARELENAHKDAEEAAGRTYQQTDDSWKTFYQNLANEEIADLPVYNNLGELSSIASKVTSDYYKKPFVHFMKNAMLDFEQAVYLVSYDIEVKLSDSYRPTEFKRMMTLQGYNYQYQKKDYSVWTDLNEYKEYLTLSRKDWLTANEAKRYRDLDSRHYKEAYRYKDTFYNKYYEAQLSFQQLQEALDLAVYAYKLPEGAEEADFYGSYAGGITTNGSGSAAKSYIKQLQIGLNNHAGTTHTLLLGDGNNLYMSNNDRLLTYNQANTEYEQAKATDGDNNEATRLKKVLLHCEQLGIQSFLLNIPDLSKNNYTTFKKFLAFQQYSYYSDWIRAGQSYQKSIVSKQEEYFRQAARMDEVGYGEGAMRERELAKIKNELGREVAFLAQVNNDTNSKPPFPKQSEDVKFETIKGEILQVNKKEEYKTYVKNKSTTHGNVEEYFRDRLIKKSWPENQTWGPLGEGYDDNGEYVEKKYSETWQISRMMFNHDYIFRHGSGEILLDLQRIEGAETTVHSYFETYMAETAQEITSGKMTYEITQTLKDKKKTTFTYKRSNIEDITVIRDEDIASELFDDDGVGYNSSLWNSNTNSWNLSGNVKWKEQPKYNTADRETDGAGTPMRHTWVKEGKQYSITFVAWCIDEDCQFEVKPDEKFGFNMKLYPKYVLDVTLAA